MTSYSLASNLPNKTLVDWENIDLWQGGRVPDDPSAQVFLKGPNTYLIEVAQDEQISIGSLDMQSSEVLIYGSLTSAGSIKVAPGSGFQLSGGALSAQSLHFTAGGIVNVDVSGVGSIDAAQAIFNDGSIFSGMTVGPTSETTLTITTPYLENSGLLEASVNSTLTVQITHAGGFANYVSGTLTGGTYEADSGGVLNLQTNGLIYNLSAEVIFDGPEVAGVINSYDPSTASYVPLEQTLSLVTQSGTLELDAGRYSTSGTLAVAGELKLIGEAQFSAGTLYITGKGHLDLILASTFGAQEEVSGGRVINDGTIFADGSGGGVAEINAPILGAGTITIGPSVTVTNEHFQQITTTATLDLTGAVSNAIIFSDGTGTLILDNPGSVTGHIRNFQAGDAIVMPNTAFSSITAWGFANGVLTLHEGNTALHLAFDGSYSTADFSLTLGENGTGTTLVGVAPAAAA